METKPKKKIASFYIDERLLDEFKEDVRKTCGNLSFRIEQLIIKYMKERK